ncbi:hypothetical protein EXIGLDRAFT_697159 [Exidia glandulosa HHB12029]|uniref:Uncharacterized protein n=1 Tax=Exidia glandulosa HHB12029 TaxID=1314781 RepID=A0A165EX57_EXIGL|nr:hypothetical protein EXIGLDRAFT_697159 [Exidia glandulosa HHB12029]
MSPVEALDLNYVPEYDTATSEDWAMPSNDFSTSLAAYYLPMELLSAQSPMATNEVDFTSYYPSVAGSIPPKNAPWLAPFALAGSRGASEVTLNQVNGSSDTLMGIYSDVPGLSTSPVSVTSSTGLVTPAAGSNAIDIFLNSLDYSGWNPSTSDSQYNKDNALAFLADGNNGNNFDNAPDVAGGSGGLPAHVPLAPSISSSTAADVAEHESDRHDVDAPLIEAPVLSSVRHSSSSRSRANYSLGGKTKPGPAIVLAHSDAADDVDNGDHDHERAAATVKRPRQKRAQRGAAEAAQFAPVVDNTPDPCANDEALARQLQEALGRPKRKRAAVASDDSPAQRAHGIATLRPMKSLPRSREPAVVAPDSDGEMYNNERPYGSTSRSGNTSRPVRPFPRRTAKRAAAVPAPTYDFDSAVMDDNGFASTSRLPDATDDNDDDEDYAYQSEDDSGDADFAPQPKTTSKRKRTSQTSAAAPKKRVRGNSAGKAAAKRKGEEPTQKELEERFGVYVTSADLRKRKAAVHVPRVLFCGGKCNKTLKNDVSYRRHMVETDNHKPEDYTYCPHMCNLCGWHAMRRDSVLRHVWSTDKLCGEDVEPEEVKRHLQGLEAEWTTRPVNSRLTRRYQQARLA